MLNKLLAGLVFLAALVCVGCESETRTRGVRVVDQGLSVEPVKIVDKRTYYDVLLNFKTGQTHREMGCLYARKVKELVPNFESLVDSYLSDITQANDSFYAVFIKRVEAIKPQVPADYRDEIEGFAGEFSGGAVGHRGDGKLSVDEAYLSNLIPDVVRMSQCSALAVYGSRSKSGNTMLERTLDWPCGLQGQLTKLQAVTTIRNGDKSVCLVGYLGFFGIVSGFNNDRVFAAILDASTGMPYPSGPMRSYPMDLRFALENESTLDGVGDYMKDPSREYAFNHLIFLADERTARVLENNLSGPGPNRHRALRADASELNDSIAWNLPDALAAVNAFLLKGNFDNFSNQPMNIARWNRLRSLVQSAGPVIDLAALKRIAAFHTSGPPWLQEKGDLYNDLTQQIILFNPETLSLQIFFRPRDGKLPDKPTFEQVPVTFGP